MEAVLAEELEWAPATIAARHDEPSQRYKMKRRSTEVEKLE